MSLAREYVFPLITAVTVTLPGKERTTQASMITQLLNYSYINECDSLITFYTCTFGTSI